MVKRTHSSRCAAIIGLLVLALALAACSDAAGTNKGGTSGATPGSSSTATPDPSPEGTTDSVETEASTFPRTVEAANGSIVIEKRPERVAVVHWGYLESILLFDLQALGLALPFTKETSSLESEQYKPYIDSIEEFAIVGENTTVNLEMLLAYAPDLIIAGNAINADVSGQLEQIATTVVIDEARIDVWTNWPALLEKLGEALGQEELAQHFIADFQSKLAEAKTQLADVEGTVAFMQVRDKMAWLGGTKTLTPYYGQGLDLQAPDNPVMTDGVEMSLEGLVSLNPDHLFLGYFNYSNPSSPVITNEWETTEVWKSLKAVQNGQTYGINGILAMGFGPIGQTYGVDAVVEALTRP